MAAATLASSTVVLAVAAGGTRYGKLCMAVGSSAKRGVRLVVAATGASPEAALSSFRMEMELFKLSPRPTHFQAPSRMLDVVAGTAQDSIRLFECVLANKSVDGKIFDALVVGGMAFLTLEGQCKDGYIRSDALIVATQSVKMCGELIFPSVKMHEFSVSSAPHSDDKTDYIDHLVQAFIVHYTSVAWVARHLFGFK